MPTFPALLLLTALAAGYPAGPARRGADDDEPPSRILVGPNDWLFRDIVLVESFTGAAGPSTKELAHWREVLEARRDWCAARDVPYVFLMVPDKHEIYPEEVPKDLKRGKSVSERFFDYMKRSDLELLDLRPALLAAKRDGLVFYQYGSHWNWRGGFLGYQAVMERLRRDFPDMEAWELSDFELVDRGEGGDDLRPYYERGDQLPPQEVVEFQPKRPRKAEPTAYWEGRPAGLMDGTVEQPGADLPRCLFLRDSFANWMWPFLAEHFSWLRLESRTTFDPALIEELDPDVIVHEAVERMIAGTSPELPASEEELKLLRRWLAGAPLKAKRGRSNEGEGPLPLGAEGSELELDFSRLTRGRDALLRVELDAAAAGELVVRWKVSAKKEDEARLPLRGGHQWIFVPLEDVRRTSEPGVVLAAEGGATVRAWSVRSAK